MFDNIPGLLPELVTAFGQTVAMLAIGLTAAVLIGGPLGVLLFLVADGQSLQNRRTGSNWRNCWKPVCSMRFSWPTCWACTTSSRAAPSPRCATACKGR